MVILTVAKTPRDVGDNVGLLADLLAETFKQQELRISEIDVTRYMKNDRNKSEPLFVLQCGFGFMEETLRQAFIDFCAFHERVIYITNDAEVGVPSQLKDIVTEVWSQVPKNGWKRVPLNFIKSGGPMLPPLQKPTKRLMYYGGFRPKRTQAFDLFFNDAELTISCSTVAERKWRERFPKCQYTRKFRLYEEMSFYSWSYYLVDRNQLDTPHGIATRYFECMRAGVPMLFQEGSEAAFEEEGIHSVYPIFSNLAEVQRFLATSNPYERLGALASQRSWFEGVDLLQRLRDDMKKAYIL